MQAVSDGPGRDRTCDLGIKSPAGQAATCCEKLKRAANRAKQRCNELKRTAACGDEPVRASVRAAAVCSDNGYGGLVSVLFGSPSVICPRDQTVRWRMIVSSARFVTGPPCGPYSTSAVTVAVSPSVVERVGCTSSVRLCDLVISTEIVFLHPTGFAGCALTPLGHYPTRFLQSQRLCTKRHCPATRLQPRCSARHPRRTLPEQLFGLYWPR